MRDFSFALAVVAGIFLPFNALVGLLILVLACLLYRQSKKPKKLPVTVYFKPLSRGYLENKKKGWTYSFLDARKTQIPSGLFFKTPFEAEEHMLEELNKKKDFDNEISLIHECSERKDRRAPNSRSKIRVTSD